MVGLFTFAQDGANTVYRAAARHDATLRQHEAMSFETGSSAVAAQLAALAEAG